MKEHADLVDGYCSGSLSDEEFAQLEEALRRDPELRRDLLESRMLESELRQFALTLDQEAARPANVTKAFLGLRAEVWAIAATIALLLLVTKAVWPEKKEVEITDREEEEVRVDLGVAVLAREDNVRWANETSQVGDSMPPGKWDLVSGTVEIQFYSGASVTLQAPAELEILSENGGILHRGRLRADVPPHAYGFSIKTAAVELVDLGTSFGMNVTDDAETEIHVFDGEVELFGKGAQPTIGKGDLLTAGQGRVVRSSGEESALQVDPSLFEGAIQLDEKSWKEYQKWRQLAAQWDRDPRLMGRYDFEMTRGSRRELSAESMLMAPEKLEGVIIGAGWSEGRWPRKMALDFKRPSDRVRVNVPSKTKSLTMIASLRIDGLDNFYNSILLSDGWNRKGALHWQILRNKSIELSVYHGEGDSPDFQSRAPFVHEASDLGRWMQFAVTYDADRGVVTHYQSGVMIGETEIDFEVPLEIGPAEIGNWTPPAKQAREIRNLNGRIDEILVFNDVLGPAEISSFYTGSKLDSTAPRPSESITKIETPTQVTPGKSASVSVSYRATKERKIALSFTLDMPPWTSFGSAEVLVPAGTDTVVVEVPIDAATPEMERAYKFDVSIVPVEGGFEDRIDFLTESGIDSVAE